jgi:hypothetical protein
MLPKIFFEKTALSNSELITTPKIHEPKVSRLLPKLCDFQKKFHIIVYGFKNL